ncbi:MAG: hypothetical protein ACKVS6_13680 [Planctomycetota bacterium]
MHLEDALHQIRAIRGQLARSEIYKGTRAGTLAATAMIANIGALLQPFAIERPELQPNVYVLFWTGAAIAAASIVSAQILYTYIRCPREHERATTRAAFFAVIPPIAIGALVSAVLAARNHHDLLPGLWPIFISLTLFSIRPLLPRAIGYVALGYALAGACILIFLSGPAAFSPWVMGLTFTIGQLATALVLYWNLERRDEPAEAEE